MPTALSVLSSPVASILLWAKSQVQSILGLNKGQVQLTLLENPPHFGGDKEIFLRPLDLVPGETTDGAGRLAVTVVRPLLVTIRSRGWTDLADVAADNWLTNPALGHLQTEEAVLSALTDILPTDAAGNALTVEPLHLNPSMLPEKSPNDGVDWGQSRLAFEMRYISNVDPTVLF